MILSEDPIDLYHAVVSSSFDADRLDYLRRDRLMTGTQAGAIDFDWLLQHVRIAEVAIEAADMDDDRSVAVQTFCLDMKALPAAEQFLLARYTLHEQVYFHKTTRCVELMISLLLGAVARLADSDPAGAERTGIAIDHPLWRFFGTKAPTLNDYLDLDDAVVLAALEPLSRSSDPDIQDLARRLRGRELFKALDLSSFGHDEGRQARRARQIDKARQANNYSGTVYKDEDATIGIYTQIGGDDDKTHKKLHIMDAGSPREITQLSKMIQTLAQKQQFTRYYFERESDRRLAGAKRGTT